MLAEIICYDAWSAVTFWLASVWLWEQYLAGFWLVCSLVIILSFIFFLWTRRATSAITHVVLGQFKTCVLLLGNYYLFGSNQGKTSICGAFTAIAGMSYYTYLNLNQKPSKTSPRQAASLPISRLSKENGSMHDGNYGGESVKQDA